MICLFVCMIACHSINETYNPSMSRIQIYFKFQIRTHCTQYNTIFTTSHLLYNQSDKQNNSYNYSHKHAKEPPLRTPPSTPSP